MSDTYFHVFCNEYTYTQDFFRQLTGGKYPNAETAARDYLKRAVNALAVAIPFHSDKAEQFFAKKGLSGCKCFRYANGDDNFILIVMPETPENLHNRVKADIVGIQPTFQI